MQLELFQHRPPNVIRESAFLQGEYRHVFGGSMERHGIRIVNCDQNFHLLYLLDTHDPLIPITIPSIRFFPILFDFRLHGDLLYKVVGEGEIEIINPEAHLGGDFPYVGYPQYFPERDVSFAQSSFIANQAQDALDYQGVFGLGHLSQSERQKAIAIVESTWRTWKCSPYHRELSAEELMEQYGHEPFVQGEPSQHCHNPNCTAPVQYISDSYEQVLSPEMAEMLGQATITIPPIVFRVPSLELFAIFRIESGDDMIYDNPCLMLYFSKCRECGCITTDNEI